MQKHGNTYFPDDRVVPVRPDGTKTAIREAGRVTGADPESGQVKVSWATGEETWHDPHELERVG